ncbi:MAG: selenium metabolism-associated LysR family transcriptional regulator [Oscillospiraceae bacterium]|nr:selenium metabolism-associated LysR family transcriptional regulator [Oscillospiraceae bacterium]
MEFRQIEAFVYVIELASFSKAAEAISMSQSSVSIYISALEKELDTTLINRSTKEATPTLAGKIFYENAKELLTLKHNTTHRIKNLSKNYSGEINVVASSVPAQYILPKVIACFNKVYPDISLNVKQIESFDVAPSITAQKAEIGFLGGTVDEVRCDFREFMTEKMVFIAPYDENISNSKEYSLEEILYERNFISREKGSGARFQYERFFLEQNINLGKINSSVSFDNNQSIINAVVSGLGISIVSEFAARAFVEKKMIEVIKLNAKLPERKFYFVLKKNYIHSHLVNLFVEFTANEMQKRSFD